jgi:hypothetical protein
MMERTVSLIVTTQVDDEDEITDNDVKREVQDTLGAGYEVSIPGT